MKPFSLPFLILGLGAVLAVGGGVYAISGSHSKTLAANQDSSSNSASSQDSSATPSTEANNDNGNNGGGGNGNGGANGGGQHMQQMFAQLDLTDAQKQQLNQIRQTVTDRKQRREQIMNVLTPDQRAKFEQLRAEHKKGGGAGGKHLSEGPDPNAPFSVPVMPQASPTPSPQGTH